MLRSAKAEHHNKMFRETNHCTDLVWEQLHLVINLGLIPQLVDNIERYGVILSGFSLANASNEYFANPVNTGSDTYPCKYISSRNISSLFL